MKELIGKRCSIVFNLPSREWPIPGYPAFATVDNVDMPMLKLINADVIPFWVNCAVVKTICEIK